MGPLTAEATQLLGRLAADRPTPLLRDAEILEALSHPDEQIRVAAGCLVRAESPVASQTLVQGALDAEPGRWTPLAGARYRYGDSADPIGRRQRAFQKWLRGQSDPAPVLDAFEALATRHTRYAIAASSPVWSPALVTAICVHEDHGLWGAMARNRALAASEPSAATLITVATEMLAVAETGSNGFHTMVRVLAKLASHKVVPADPLAFAQGVFARANADRNTIDPHQRRSHRDALVMAVDILCAVPALPDTTWGAWLDGAREFPHAVAQLIRHPSCPNWVAVRALSDHPRALIVRRAVADVPRFVLDAGIRSALLEHGVGGGVMRKLQALVPGSEADAYFARLAMRNPSVAAQVLARPVAGPAIGVTSPTLERLLNDTNEATRARAMMGLSHVAIRDPAPDSPPTADVPKRQTL
jgi:hypothetical protein